jgi:hypothetical protein
MHRSLDRAVALFRREHAAMLPTAKEGYREERDEVVRKLVEMERTVERG